MWLHSHLTQQGCDGTMRSGQDPSVCVLLTDLSHMITMATGAVAMATASAQSVLQLDARVVAAWVTVFGGRQVSLTFTKVNPPSPPLPLSSLQLYFLCLLLPPSSPSEGKQHSPLLPSSPHFTFVPFLKHLMQFHHLSLFSYSPFF